MECKTCEGSTRVTHTYRALDTKVTERVCEQGHRHVYVTLHLQEANRQGKGAYAVASKIKKGEITLNGIQEDPQEKEAVEG